MNKKRHIQKKNGLSNSNYCHHCLSYNFNSMFFQDTITTRKRLHRRRSGLCEACGKRVCTCRSKEANKVNYKR